jgi:hypothetical protein
LPRSFIGKLLLKGGDNPLKQLWTRGSQNNVINVEEVGNPISVVIYEQGSIGLGLNKP